MKRFLKNVLLGGLANPLMGRIAMGYGPPRCAVLMLHRFTSADGNTSGHDPAKLRALLAGLRRSRVALVDAASAIETMAGAATGASMPKVSLAFTVDDGYADLVEVAEPIFSEFDCPVTGFVVPGVIDGNCWFWWDQIDWIMRHTEAKVLSLELQGQPVILRWSDAQTRHVEKSLLVERLKDVDHSLLLQFVVEIARVADVPIPLFPPSRYRVLGWEELRKAERGGMRFGAHSMTHPILANCGAAQSVYEISESIRRVRQELTHPSPVFCYPNGRHIDFGLREMSAVRQSGVTTALSAEPRLLRQRDENAGDVDWRLNIPRFSYVDDLGSLTRLLIR